MTEAPTATPPSRSARKRQTILSAGQALFLDGGYQGTSVDQIAARASVSKQTVYKHFGDKQELLFAIVTDALDTAAAPFLDRIAALPQTTDLRADLIALAEEYLHAVLAEPVVQLRRLVIAEANRLPELARLYYDHAPTRTLAALTDGFRALHDRGLLDAPQPRLAAEHFASSSSASRSTRPCSAGARLSWPISIPARMCRRVSTSSWRATVLPPADGAP